MISNFTRSSSVVFDTPLLITGGCVRQCLRVILTLILVNPMTSLAFAKDSQPNYVVLPVEVRKAEVRVVEQVPPSISIPPHVLAPFVGRPLLMDEMSGIPYGRALIGVGGQSMWGQFNQFLATDLPASANGLYTTFRPDKEILDPASGEMPNESRRSKRRVQGLNACLNAGRHNSLVKACDPPSQTE